MKQTTDRIIQKIRFNLISKFFRLCVLGTFHCIPVLAVIFISQHDTVSQKVLTCSPEVNHYLQGCSVPFAVKTEHRVLRLVFHIH